MDKSLATSKLRRISEERRKKTWKIDDMIELMNNEGRNKEALRIEQSEDFSNAVKFLIKKRVEMIRKLACDQDSCNAGITLSIISVTQWRPISAVCENNRPYVSPPRIQWNKNETVAFHLRVTRARCIPLNFPRVCCSSRCSFSVELFSLQLVS